MRHVELGVAVLAAVHIEHELDQGAVQPGNVTTEYGEACAGEVCSSDTVHATDGLTQLDVIPHVEIEHRRFAPAPNLDIVIFIGAIRHGWMRYIRQAGVDVI